MYHLHHVLIILESLTWNSHWYDDGPMAISCVLAALICKKFILNHLDSTLRSELITNCKIRLNKAARTERFPVSAAKFSSGKQGDLCRRNVDAYPTGRFALYNDVKFIAPAGISPGRRNPEEAL